MTNDPITAVLQQLADHHDQLTQLTELITGIGDTLREHQAALETLAQTPPADPAGYQPNPPPSWWKLATADRGAPRVWWRLDSPQMLLSGWPLSSTVPPPGGTTV